MTYSGSYRFQRYDVNKTIKNIRFFGFAGGMASQYHPEKLADGQHILVENADIIAGGTLINRGAYAQTNNPSTAISGMTQGRYRFYTTSGYTDIVAINGQFYTVSGNTYTQQTITGLSSGFQTTRPVEGIQYRNKMYFATGSGIVTYDGTSFSTITAYAPNGLEALYIGTNGYATNPSAYLSDTTGAADAILGVVPSTRYGVANQNVTFTAYIESVSGDTLQYQWETKKVSDGDYTVAQAWGSSKTFTTAFIDKDNYQIRVSLRKSGTTTTLSQYVLPKYTVNATPDENPEPDLNFSNLSTCNRIFVHYDRLFIYGDTTNPDNLYISHLDNFTYFPRTNVITITDPLRGALQAVIRFKNFLVCFTDGSIQQITGQDPSNYAVNPIHTALGTKNPYSIQVMQNYVAFVGNDNGVYILKTFNYASTDYKMNVQRLDNDIKDLIVGHISSSTKTDSCIYNNQYYLYVQTPTNNYIYRYYYDLNCWVRDSLSFQVATMDTVDNAITLTTTNGGTICKLQRGVYNDLVNTPFYMHLISKDYDMNMPHHRKKMKQFQLLCNLTELSAMDITVYGDNLPLVTQPVTHDPQQDSDADKLKVTTSGRFRYTKVEIMLQVTEDVQMLGYAFIFKLNTPK